MSGEASDEMNFPALFYVYALSDICPPEKRKRKKKKI
jgi:hypothetical protein